MKIISLPRSGATQYCMDLASSYGLTFRGELRKDMCSEYGDYATIKSLHHESGYLCQPVYHTVSEYLEALKDPNSLWLVNDHNDVSSHLPEAAGVMLRKRYMDSFYSLAMLFDAQVKHVERPAYWVNNWDCYVANLSVILDWIIANPETPVLWYENYFPNKSRTYGTEERTSAAILPLLRRYNIAEKMMEVQKIA